jgi:undecaprenyl-diphosphatase
MFRKIRAFDNKVVGRITGIHKPFLDKVMIIATYAGTGALVWWTALVAPFLISTKYRKTGVMMALALAFNYLIGEIIIKKSVGRDRPSSLLSDEEMKITRPKDHSFPSGHTASSFCAFTVTLLCCTPAVWIPALILAATIGFSRVYLRVHYVSDVIGGLILGVIDGTAVTLILQRVFANVAFY